MLFDFFKTIYLSRANSTLVIKNQEYIRNNVRTLKNIIT
jgi:hypothetical protein